MIELSGYRIYEEPRTNCRRLILRYRKGERCFHLSEPRGVSRKQVMDFLRSQLAWMEETLPRSQLSAWQPAFLSGERHCVLGSYVTLGEGGVPDGEAAFQQWRADLARDAVARLLPVWEKRMGVRAEGVRWRLMTSRWGTCQTGTRLITLNLRLAAMPVELMEYVLVHELNHLRHADHSPAFHADMTRFLPDWRARRQRLNQADVSPRPGDENA